MFRKKRQVGLIAYIREYLDITQAKIIIWGLFLVPYVLVIIYYSGVLPTVVQAQIHQFVITSDLAAVFGTTQIVPRDIDPGLLTMSYFLVTYLWSCILVENFGTMRYCLWHGRRDSTIGRDSRRRGKRNGK